MNNLFLETCRRRLLAVALVVAAAVTPVVSAQSAEEKWNPNAPRNEETFRAIIKAGAEPNRDVRARVAWVLGLMEQPEAVATLKKLAQDDSAEVRAGALFALRDLLPRGSIVEVKLDVPVGFALLRLAALDVASHLKFDQRVKLIEAALSAPEPAAALDREKAVRALTLDDPAAVRDTLKKTMQDAHALVRAATVVSLAVGNDDEAVSLVLAGLAEMDRADSFLVRAGACKALGLMKTDKGADQLYAAVADTHYYVRRSAIEAIVARKDPQGLPAIQRQATEADYTIRVAACQAMGAIIRKPSSPVLAGRLADDVPEVRAAADDALKLFPPELAYEALHEWVDYKDRTETRERVWRLLGEYGYEGSREVAWTHLNDPDAFVQVDALRILRKLADRRIIPHVKGLLKLNMKRMKNSPPPEGAIEESFLAATLFQLPDCVPGAIFIFKSAIVPPMAEPIYVPADTTVIAALEYVRVIKATEAIPAMKSLYNYAMEMRSDSLVKLSSVLHEMTGEDFPVPEVKKHEKPKGVYFIDIRKGGEEVDEGDAAGE